MEDDDELVCSECDGELDDWALESYEALPDRYPDGPVCGECQIPF